VSRADRSFTDVYTAALQGETCRVVGRVDPADGPAHPPGARGREEWPLLPVSRWSGAVDVADRVVLAHCEGTVLDVGCGPGRMSAHLVAQGHHVLGIDVVDEAVSLTRDRGAEALRRDVFDPLPGEGAWGTALLADGNIGIGGDPVALLRRLADVVARDGRVVADLAAPGTGVVSGRMRLEGADGRSRPFPWAEVGADAIGAVAEAAGLHVAGLHEHDGRWFAVLERGDADARPR
jgi:SAM-dependent methyltransferase